MAFEVDAITIDHIRLGFRIIKSTTMWITDEETPGSDHQNHGAGKLWQSCAMPDSLRPSSSIVSDRSIADSAPAFLGASLAASLTVNDLSASVEWYCAVIGFAIDRRHEREGKLMAVSLRAGDVRILLTQDDGAKGEGRVKGAGFSLQITTDQDLDSFAAGIEARGGTLENDPVDTPWGVRMFRLRDPDGFRFTISSKL